MRDREARGRNRASRCVGVSDMVTRLLYLARHAEQDLTGLSSAATEEPDSGLSERGRQ